MLQVDAIVAVAELDLHSTHNLKFTPFSSLSLGCTGRGHQSTAFKTIQSCAAAPAARSATRAQYSPQNQQALSDIFSRRDAVRVANSRSASPTFGRIDNMRSGKPVVQIASGSQKFLLR